MNQNQNRKTIMLTVSVVLGVTLIAGLISIPPVRESFAQGQCGINCKEGNSAEKIRDNSGITDDDVKKSPNLKGTNDGEKASDELRATPSGLPQSNTTGSENLTLANPLGNNNSQTPGKDNPTQIQ